MNYFNLAIIVVLAFAAFLFVCAILKGVTRGGVRSFIRLVIVALCAAIAFFGVQPIVDTAITTDLTGYEIKDFLNNSGTNITGTFKDYVIHYLESLDTIGDVIRNSQEVRNLITGVPGAIVSTIMLLFIFVILKFVSLIVYAICKCFVPKYQKDASGNYVRNKRNKKVKKKKNKLAGFFFSLIQAILVFVIINIPILGTAGFLKDAYTELKDSDFVQEKLSEKTFDDGTTLLDKIDEGVAKLDNSFLGSLHVMDFEKNCLYKIYKTKDSEDGTQKGYYVFEELAKLLPVAGDALDSAQALQKLNDLDNLKSEDLQSVADLLLNLKESEMIANIASDVLSAGAKALVNGEDFLGMNLETMLGELDESTKDDLTDVIRSLGDATSESIKKDLEVLGNVMQLVVDYNIVENIPAVEEGEEANGLGRILEAITSSVKEDSESSFVTELFDTLSESEHFRALVPAALNAGLKSVTDSMGIPKSKEAAQDKMMDSMTEAVNNEENKGIDQDELDAIIAAMAAENESTKAPAVNNFAYLAGEKNSYEKYCDLRQSLVSSMQTAGVDLASSAHIYTAKNGTKYIEVDGKWKVYDENYLAQLDAEERLKVLKEENAAKAVSSLVLTVIDLQQTGTVVDKSTFEEAIIEVSKEVPELKKVSDKETFKETSTITTFEDLKFSINDITEENIKSIGKAANDLLEVATVVVKNSSSLTGEDATAGMMKMINELPLEKVGSALDNLNSIGGKQNLAGDLIKAISESPTVAQDETLSNVINVVNNVVNSDDPDKKTDFTEIMNVMGAFTKFTKLFEGMDGTEFDVATNFRNFKAEDWAEVLFALNKADKTTLETFMDSIDDIINVALEGQSVQGIDTVLHAVVEAIKEQNYTKQEDAIRDGDAMYSLFTLMLDLTSSESTIKFPEEATGAERNAIIFDFVKENIEKIVGTDASTKTVVTSILKAVAEDMAETITTGGTYFGMEELKYVNLVDGDNNGYGTQLLDAMFVLLLNLNEDKLGTDMVAILDAFYVVANAEDACVFDNPAPYGKNSVACKFTWALQECYIVNSDNSKTCLAQILLSAGSFEMVKDEPSFANLIAILQNIANATAK